MLKLKPKEEDDVCGDEMQERRVQRTMITSPRDESGCVCVAQDLWAPQSAAWETGTQERRTNGAVL